MSMKLLHVVACATALLCAIPALATKPEPAVSDPVSVQGGEYRLSGRAFVGDKVGKHPVLLVVIHGDAPHNKPDYHYAFASKVVAGRDVVAVGLLRPGYVDPQGGASEGERGEAVGDSYNARNTDSVAAAIGELKRRYRSRKVVVAAHSGGAAIAANVLARHRRLIDAALLVSCPCDVGAWRKSMFALTQEPAFEGEVESLSPIDQVGKLSSRVRVTLVVGKQDPVAPPTLSERYQAAAMREGKHVTLVELDGQEHEIFLLPQVRELLGPMLK